jgi:predicted permease
MSRFRRIMNLFARPALNREIDRELQSHIEMRIEDNIARGMSAEAARRDALLRFGNPASTREQVASADASLLFAGIVADLAYAVRQLRKSPGFAATAVLTMALGIGANLAVFQLLYGVMFAHLPVPKPAELYSIHAVPSPFDGEPFLSYPAYRRVREASKDSVPVFGRSGVGQGVFQQTDGATSRVDFQLVSDNFFSTLGLEPTLGRFFEPGDDERQTSEFPVILRGGFFREHFGGDRSILGRRATLNGIPIVVIGVAPDGFNGVMQGMAPDIWLPLAAQATTRFGTWFDSLGPGYAVDLSKSYLNQPTIFWIWTLARVPDGAAAAASARWMSALAPDVAMMAAAAKDPQVRAKVLAARIQLVSAANGEGRLRKRYGRPLTILMAMAGVILLVGCLNLANLQMARLVQREREIAIRISLGASRARMLRQLATESFVLAAIGGPLAWLTARVSSGLLLHWTSGRGPAIAIDLRLSATAFFAGAALLLATLIGFGLLPAWQFTRKSFSTAVKARVGSLPAQSKASQRWSNLLLAGQVALSLLLVSTAALFAQTLRNLAQIDAGMDRAHLLAVNLDMHSTGFADAQPNLTAFYNQLMQRLDALPGVRDAAVQMCDIPQCGWNTAIHVFGMPDMPEAQMHGEEDHVGLGYFRTVGIPLLEGRDFSSADTPKAQKVAILNHAYARQLFGAASPIGHWIGYNSDHDFLIVGEVGDARVDGLRNDPPPMVYMPLEQHPTAVQTIDVRAQGSIKALPAEIRAALHEVAPALPVTDIVPMDAQFEDSLSTEELLARLTSVFGALTLALAALGFYGLLSFRVARRTSEIGVRMALGATRTQVRALFLRQTLGILFAGTIPGAGLSIAMYSLAHKLLYGAGSMNGIALGFAACILGVVGLLATLIPAHRAASVDPMEALRSE